VSAWGPGGPTAITKKKEKEKKHAVTIIKKK
jgi:hypothetical protein